MGIGDDLKGISKDLKIDVFLIDSDVNGILGLIGVGVLDLKIDGIVNGLNGIGILKNLIIEDLIS